MNRGSQLFALAAGLAVGAIMMLLVTRASQINNGDWLQFLGGLLGVSLAVFGAVLVEDWKRERSRREERALLHDAIVELQRTLNTSASVRIVEYEGEPEVRKLILETFSRLEAIQELLITVRAKAKIVDIALWQDLHTLERAIRDDLPSVRDEVQRLTKSGRESPDTPHVLLNFGMKHQTLIREIAEQLRHERPEGAVRLGSKADLSG